MAFMAIGGRGLYEAEDLRKYHEERIAGFAPVSVCGHTGVGTDAGSKS